MIFLCPESPRWLLSTGQREKALKSISKLRHLPLDHPVLQAEIAGMDIQLLHESEAVGNASQWALLKETLLPVENRRRFFLIFMATLFSQWSGANAITQYSPTIFGYLGIDGDESKFLATGIYAVVKFVSTLAFALFIVDFVGRRRSLMTGISAQLLTLIYVGAYLGRTRHLSPDQISSTPDAARASTAAIVAIYIHAVAWSIGWFSIPYLIGSEIFPTKIRSFNMSIAMGFHWAFYFGCSRAMPSLLAASQRWGAFVFFGSICLVSLVYVFFAMPVSSSFLFHFVFDLLFYSSWLLICMLRTGHNRPLSRGTGQPLPAPVVHSARGSLRQDRRDPNRAAGQDRAGTPQRASRVGLATGYGRQSARAGIGKHACGFRVG